MDTQEIKEHSERRRRHSRRRRHHRHRTSSADRWVRRAMFVFGVVGVLVIGRELWRFHAGPETLDDAAPIDAAGAEPLIRPEMRSDPRASAHPIRLDPLMPSAMRSITTAPHDAVERCVVNGKVVYAASAECRGSAAAPAPVPADVPSPSSADGATANLPAAPRSVEALATQPAAAGLAGSATR